MKSAADKPSATPQGHYVLARRHRDLVFSSGMTPRRNGQLMYTGPVKASEPIATYREAVVLACANALYALQQAMVDGEKLAQILNLMVFVAAEPDFKAHTQLADFASQYLHTEFGDAGIGSRSAIGVTSLPGHALVEIQIIAAVA